MTYAGAVASAPGSDEGLRHAVPADPPPSYDVSCNFAIERAGCWPRWSIAPRGAIASKPRVARCGALARRRRGCSCGCISLRCRSERAPLRQRGPRSDILVQRRSNLLGACGYCDFGWGAALPDQRRAAHRRSVVCVWQGLDAHIWHAAATGGVFHKALDGRRTLVVNLHGAQVKLVPK